MKKIISCILAIIFLSQFCLVASANVNLGDINGSGKIDMTDYILLKRAYFGTYELDAQQKQNGDINSNGKIDMTDYILLKRVYFGTYSLTPQFKEGIYYDVNSTMEYGREYVKIQAKNDRSFTFSVGMTYAVILGDTIAYLTKEGDKAVFSSDIISGYIALGSNGEITLVVENTYVGYINTGAYKYKYFGTQNDADIAYNKMVLLTSFGTNAWTPDIGSVCYWGHDELMMRFHEDGTLTYILGTDYETTIEYRKFKCSYKVTADKLYIDGNAYSLRTNTSGAGTTMTIKALGDYAIDFSGDFTCDFNEFMAYYSDKLNYESKKPTDFPEYLKKPNANTKEYRMTDYYGLTINDVTEIWGNDYELSGWLIAGGWRAVYFENCPFVFCYLTDYNDLEKDYCTGYERIASVILYSPSNQDKGYYVVGDLEVTSEYDEIANYLPGEVYYNEMDGGYAYSCEEYTDYRIHFLWEYQIENMPGEITVSFEYGN